MCGIAGLLRLDGGSPTHAQIDALNRRQIHRGPDGEGIFLDGPVGLGHRRLAIIDPSGGNQPMRNESGDVWLVANGEVYNFRELRSELEALGHCFTSHSDCEVIVHGYEAWGDGVVPRLRGMFAFALWDGRRRQLLLARDRLGIKPLCYSHNAGRFAFASEIQALRALPNFDATVDTEALDRYLHLQYIPAPQSIYRGVRKLPPAHTLTITPDGGEPVLRRYWQLTWQPDESLTEAEWVERLDAALGDAVRSHLVADVPFGAFLSGGVDSSTVAAYMAETLGQGLETFTIGFDQGGFDERGPAHEAAVRLGSRHHESVVGLDILDLLPRLVHHYGEPFADSSALCTWRVCEAARESVTMVLSGDGGDELFAGYPYYPKLVEQFPAMSAPRRTRRLAGDLLRRLGLLNPVPTLAESWYGRSPFFDDALRRRLWWPDYHDRIGTTRTWHEAQFARIARLDTLSQCQSVDLQTYLPFDNLTKVDIASMAHGLEVRVPLLDHPLLETVMRIPARYRLARIDARGQFRGEDWCGKYILKRAAQCFYPWEFLQRPKMGFSVPLADWFAGANKDELQDRLLDSAAGLDEWFDPTEMRRLVEEHGQSADHGHRLWALLFLAEWRVQQHP